MLTGQLATAISDGSLDKIFAGLYGEDGITAARSRWSNAIAGFESLYGTSREVSLFSVPGRSEILGNHTDHNHGRVIAASINLDVIAVASVRDDTLINVKSEGFPADNIDIADLSMRECEKGGSAAILRGVCASFVRSGYSVGGFDAYTTSNVLKGSGLSSSAAFEIMCGKIESCYYNSDKLSAIELAQIGQAAENAYFGKPCGLMDQTACASGGFVTIDFADPSAPVVEKLSFDLAANGIYLCITDTGGNHADLTDDYAAIPNEMKSVARKLGQETLRGITIGQLLDNAEMLRGSNDRAFLRAIHFAGENDRVFAAADAIRRRDTDAFLNYITASGNSSFKFLQNIFTTKSPLEQGVTTGLAASECFLAGRRGACRVHGGGFAGTIQAFIEKKDVGDYAAMMDSIFGSGACHILFVRDAGAVRVSV